MTDTDQTAAVANTEPTSGHRSREEEIRARVQERYGSIARIVLEGRAGTGCCGPTATATTAPEPPASQARGDAAEEVDPPGCCGAALNPAGARADLTTSSGPSGPAPTGRAGEDPITRNLYHEEQADQIPEAALLASLGCGNPTALAHLAQGEKVLDLGSGGGIDVLLSARRVGPAGYAYGIDMTEEMLELARRNKAEAGVTNAEFLQGHIEDIPLPDDHVDLVISNCVINLSVDKPKVFGEIFRVLAPGGRVAVSDIVVRGPLDPAIRSKAEAWIGCVAGALEEGEYRRGLEAAGFSDVHIEPTRIFSLEDAAELVEKNDLDPEAVSEAATHIVSAFVRATKPA